MSIDGRELGRAHTIKSDDLGVGTSILEVRGRTPGEEETIQVVLDVLPPVELTVREPISFLKGGKTTVKFPVRVRNGSRSDQSVVVEVVARPEGWLGGIAENPCQRLDPGKGCTVHVALERVVPPSRRELSKQFLPVTLRAIPNGDVRSAVFVSAYLDAEAGATRKGRSARRPRAKAKRG